MTATITIFRYRKRHIPFALLAMILFRLPLWYNKKSVFWKLMGSGKNGTFDKKPDWQQWGILAVHGSLSVDSIANDLLGELYGDFIAEWARFFKCETWTVLLEPFEGHGQWDGKKVFGELSAKTDYSGKIAVLTRATIRLSRLKRFWSHVGAVSSKMAGAKGFVYSLGIGEIPWIKQATFSIWDSKEDMKSFAYQLKEHTEVIQRTRSENWYSEDMFVRFKILASFGTVQGINPLEVKL